MTYFVLFLGLGFVLGGLGVASNPSPYYGVIGLVASVTGCGWLLSLGVSFVALVLFMVYLGGMLVVFVYSVSLAADPFPEACGDWCVMGYGLGFVLVLVVGVVAGGFIEGWKLGLVTVDSGGMFSVRLDFSGVAMFYSRGAGMLFGGGMGAIINIVVLEVVWELSQCAIRAM